MSLPRGLVPRKVARRRLCLCPVTRSLPLRPLRPVSRFLSLRALKPLQGQEGLEALAGRQRLLCLQHKCLSCPKEMVLQQFHFSPCTSLSKMCTRKPSR